VRRLGLHQEKSLFGTRRGSDRLRIKGKDVRLSVGFDVIQGLYVRLIGLYDFKTQRPHDRAGIWGVVR
jgi:hypothetical protein